MAEPYVELPADEFDPDADWLEAVDSTEPGGSANISHGAQEAFLSGYVPWNKVRSATRWFLGFAWSDGTRLKREMPAAHPVLPWLYAHSVSYKGFGIKSNTDNPSNRPYKNALFPGVDKIVPRVGYYEDVQLTVRFRDFGNMKFLTDDQVSATQEYKRWTSVHIIPSIQELTADGLAQLIWAEGGPPPSGTIVPASFPYLMAKSGYVLKWHQVPEAYLSNDPVLFFPENILNCVGRVNDDTFLNSPAGTLLLQPPEFESGRFAVPTDTFGELLTFWNVALKFEYFDPDKGVPASVRQGHNLMPYRVDGKWYYANRGATADITDPGLYLEADFDQIFSINT